MYSFLYCFDINYNIQASVSIYSLLEHVDENIDIFVIHQNSNDLYMPEIILNHKNLNSLKVYDFKNENYIFPNIENAHVSEATYYRFFIEKYLPSNLDFVTYLDADIVIVKNPLRLIREHKDNLEKTNFTISVNSEPQSENESIKLKNNKYFNAGVMLIDYKKWLKKDMLNNLVELTQKRKNDLVFWDQDVLNIYFDGEYLELSQFLNYKLDFSPYQHIKKEKLDKNVSFIHYSGKFKPWSLKGIENNASAYYQNNFRQLYHSRYHLSDNWKVNTLKDFIRIIFSGRILRIAFPFALIKIVVIFLITKRK